MGLANGSVANSSTPCPYIWEDGKRNITAVCCSERDHNFYLDFGYDPTLAAVIGSVVAILVWVFCVVSYLTYKHGWCFCRENKVGHGDENREINAEQHNLDDPVWWEKRRIAFDIFRLFATLFAAMFFFPIPSVHLNISAKVAIIPLVFLDVIFFVAFLVWQRNEKFIKPLKYYVFCYVLTTGFPIGFIAKFVVASHYDDPQNVPLFALFLPHGILFYILPLIALVYFIRKTCQKEDEHCGWVFSLPCFGSFCALLILLAVWVLNMLQITYYVWPKSLPYITNMEYLAPCTLSQALAPLWLLLLCTLIVTHSYFFSSIKRGRRSKSVALHLAPDLLHLCGMCCTAVILTFYYDQQLKPVPYIDQYMKPFWPLLLADTLGIVGVLYSLCNHYCSGTSCKYHLACERFKKSLEISACHFSPEHDKCFCETCHNARGEPKIDLLGEPPMRYAVPLGWTRFGLRVNSNFMDSDLKVFSTWHRAYHGTDHSSVKKILQAGSVLVMPGDEVLGGYMIGHFNKSRKPAGLDTKQVFVSPSIVYAGLQRYARSEMFKDEYDGKSYNARVAFQLCIRPGSYTVGPETVNATETMDPAFHNVELEWSTKERGGQVLYGLLIKLEPIVEL